MSDSVKEAIVLSTALVVITALIVSLIAYCRYNDTLRIKAGYHWAPTVEGHWEKDKDKGKDK